MMKNLKKERVNNRAERSKRGLGTIKGQEKRINDQGWRRDQGRMKILGTLRTGGATATRGQEGASEAIKVLLEAGRTEVVGVVTEAVARVERREDVVVDTVMTIMLTVGSLMMMPIIPRKSRT